MKSALVCIAKEEEKYILEWINYNLKLGFNDIFICNNDWEFEYIHPNVHIIPINGKRMQWHAYNTCYNKLKESYNWIAFFDVDEFLVLKKHESVNEFLNDYIEYPAIGINWVFFGDNDLSGQEIKDYSVLSRFTKRQEGVHSSIKSIVNTSYPHTFINIHNPVSNIVDTNFNVFTDHSNPKGSDEIAQLNHYWCKTKEEFEIKVMKGRADIDEPRNISDFDNNNYNQVVDTTAYDFYKN